MASKKHAQDKQSLGLQAFYRFLGGAALGTFMVSIPYWFMSIQADFLHIGVGALLVVLCGTLGSLWGEAFLESLAEAFNTSGL